MTEPETLVRIVAPHFVAAVVVVADRVTVAAPILSYMYGWPSDRVRQYVAGKGWRASIVRPAA